MVEKIVPSPYLRAQFQGHIDKPNGERTANIKGDSHKPRRDSDYGDNDTSLPDGNAAAPGLSSDLKAGSSHTRGAHMRRTISAEARTKARYAKNWSGERRPVVFMTITEAKTHVYRRQPYLRTGVRVQWVSR